MPDSISERLSDRKFAVLRGIANGMPNTQIAAQLNLSAKSNVELARYAQTHSLLK